MSESFWRLLLWFSWVYPFVLVVIRVAMSVNDVSVLGVLPIAPTIVTVGTLMAWLPRPILKSRGFTGAPMLVVVWPKMYLKGTG